MDKATKWRQLYQPCSLLSSHFFRLIRSLADPSLAAFIVCGPLQFLVSQLCLPIGAYSSRQRNDGPEPATTVLVRYINILTWLRGLQDKLACLVLFSLYPSLWEFTDKRQFTDNLQFCPKSLGAMLEYWYTERGLLPETVAWGPFLRKDPVT